MADFEYNPVAGWEDETIFPDYPTAQEVRPMLQRLFDQIRDAFNAHKADIVTDSDGVHGLKVEEDTWTPAFVGSTTAGSNTYSEQVGKYYKIGKLVFLSGRIALSTKDGAMAGNVRISGLPFTSETSGAMAGISIALASAFDFATGYTQLAGRVTQNTNYIDMILIGDNVANGTVSATSIGNTTSITFSAVYKTA
jgi:hypothetical protein